MEINLKSLDTEQRNTRTMDLDSLSTAQILSKINSEDKKIADVVEQQIPDIEKIVEAAYQQIKKGGRLIYIGAGTSGRLGILDASECPPTYGVSPELIQGLIAGGMKAIFKAQEGAEDSKALAVEDLKGIELSDKDMVVGLAASGRTPYVVGGLEYANSIGAKTGSICCVENGAISNVATFSVEAVVGPEAVTGSTRMKAGTAQKMILNMISTTVMIRYGKVYQNLMVDVQTTNEKLKKRAADIISLAIECDIEKANELLLTCGFDVKAAIIMGITGFDKKACSEKLKESDGNISKAIHTLKEKLK